MEDTFIKALKKDAEPTQNIAMDNYLSGTPIVEPSTLAPATPPTPTVESGKDVKAEVMSKLNLVDEDFNYTDTYTNYINKGGAPLPGYEAAHTQILREEKITSMFETLPHDEALMETYGKDVLKSLNINTDSTAYWMNKYHNNDFSNPYDNAVLMKQVRDEAEAHYQADIMQHSKISDTALSSLVEKRLSAKEIRSVFGENWDEALTSLSDTKLQEALYSDSISSSLRLTRDQNGTYYYLHNDGKLYKLDSSTSSIDSNGNLTGIFIGGKAETHFNALTSGAASVFTSIAKAAANIAGTVTTALFSEDFSWEDATEWGRQIDIFMNKNLNDFATSGYIDLSSDFSLMDFTHMGMNLLGSIAGVYTLGAISGTVESVGNSLLNSTSTLSHGLGHATKAASTLLKWQTGNFGTVNTGDSFLVKFGTRLATASVANLKEFTLNAQRLATNTQLSDAEIAQRSFTIMAVNTLIDTAIGGGINDNTWQTYSGRDTFVSTDKLKTLLGGYDDARQAIVEKTLDAATNEELKKILKSNDCVIKFNSVLDFVANYLTGIVSSHAAVDEKGELKEFELKDFDPFRSENLSYIIPAAMNSYFYSYRGQKREYNVAMDNIKGIHTRFLGRLDEKISETHTPKDLQTLTQIKQDYIDIFRSTSGTTEEKILTAMSKISDKLGAVPDTIKASIDTVVKPAKIKHLKDVYDESELLFEARLARANGLFKPESDKTRGMLDLIKNRYIDYSSRLKHPLTNKRAQDKEALQTYNRDLVIEKNVEELFAYSGLINSDETINKALDSLSKGVDSLDKLDGLTTYNDIISLKKTDPELYDKLLMKLDKKSIENGTFITIKQNAEASTELKTIKAAYALCEDLGLITPIFEEENIYGFIADDDISRANISMTMNAIIKASVKLERAKSDMEVTEVISDVLTVIGVDKDTAPVRRINAALTMLNRAETSKLLTTEQATKAFVDLLNNKILDKSYYNISDNKTLLAIYNKYKARANVFKALTIADSDPVKFRSLIDLSDEETKAAIKDLLDSKDLPENLRASIEKINTDHFFQSGDTKGFQKFIVYKLNNQFTNHTVSPEVISEIGDDITKEELRRYVKAFAPEVSEKEVSSFVNDLYNTWDKVYAQTTQAASMHDDIVFIDLRNIPGRYTDKLIRVLELKNDARIKDLNDPKSVENQNSIAREFDTRSSLIANNSPIMMFDLKDQKQIDMFNNIMKRLNYNIKLKDASKLDENKNILISNGNTLGLSYNTKELRVLKTPRVSNIDKILFKAFEDGYINIDGKQIKLREVEYLDYNGNKISKPNVVDTVISESDIKNIDPTLKVGMKQFPLMEILPLNPQESYTPEEVALSILYGTNELKLKVGKMAGSTEKVVDSLSVKTAAAVIARNEDLANYFTLSLIVDNLCDDNLPLKLNGADYDILKSQGLVDSEDSFWELSGTKHNGYLRLKDTSDAGRIRMKQAILEKDFNVLKLIPLINYTNEQQEKVRQHGYIDSSNDLDIYYGDLAGGARHTALGSIFNINLPWDNAERAYARSFFEALLNVTPDKKGNYYFNPLKKAKLDQPEFGENGKSYKILDNADFDAFYKDIAKKKDPNSILIKAYIDEFNNLLKTHRDSPDIENWRILLKNRKVLNIFNSNKELTPEAIEDIKTLYRFAKTPMENSVDLSKRLPVHTPRGTVVAPGQVLVSPDILANIMGGFENLYFTKPDGTVWTPEIEDIENAYKAFTLMKVEIEDNASDLPYRHIGARYVESNASKLLSIVGPSEGYVRIEDAEAVAQLISSNYNAAIEDAGVNFELTHNPDTLAVMKAIFGNAEEASKIIFAQARKNHSLVEKVKPKNVFTHQEATGTTTIRKKQLSNSPTQELGPNYTLSRGGKNYYRRKAFLGNLIANKQDRYKFGEWQKLQSLTQDYEDYEAINSAYRNKVEDLKLYEEQHGNYSRSFVFSKDHNAKSAAYTTIKTARAIEQEFKTLPGMNISEESVKNNIMELADTLTGMFEGRTVFSGRSTKYVFVDPTTAKIKNMEDFTAENLSELFFKLVNNKSELKNSIIVTADIKEAGSVTPLNVKYKYLKDDMEYQSFITDLYHNWVIENEFSIRRALDMNDSESLLELIGGSVIDDSKLKEAINSIPRYSISEKEETQLIWQQVRDLKADISKKDFYKLMKYSLSEFDSYSDAKDRYTAAQNLIDAEVGVNNARPLSDSERQRANLIKFGLDPDLITKARAKALNTLRKNMGSDIKNAEARKYVRDYFKGDPTAEVHLKKLIKNNPEVKEDILNSFLIYNNSAAMLDLLCRNRDLVKLKEERYSKSSSSELIISNNGDTISTQTMRDLCHSIKYGDKNKTPYTTRIGFDTETTNINNLQGEKESVLNLSVAIDKFIDGQWKHITKVYNIKHGDMSAQEWVNKYINRDNDAFYLNSEGYRLDVENYLKTPGFLPADIKKELLSYIDPNHTLLIGHNIDEADIKWLKVSDIFDSELLSKVTPIDTIQIAKNNLKDERAYRSLKQTDLLMELSNINHNTSAHSSLQDAEDSLVLFDALVDLDYDINKLRTSVIGELESFGKKVGIKVTDNDLELMNASLQRGRKNSESVLQDLNSDYKVTNDSVSILRDAFNYHLKKDFSKLVYELSDANSYSLSPTAQKVLLSGSYKPIFRLLAYTEDNNIAFTSVLKAIKSTMDLDYINEETVLTTLGNKTKFQQVLNNLNITEEDLKNYKAEDSIPVFSGDITASDKVDQKSFALYNSLKGTYKIAENFQNAMSAMNIENSDVKNLLMSKLLTFYDIDSEVIDPDQLLAGLKPKYIESKYDKAYRDILEGRYGNVKALYDIPQKGAYGLITSFNTGTIYKDITSGKNVNVVADASMAIITKTSFESLVGMSLEDYRELHPVDELYTNILIHPADGNNKILSRRLVIVDTLDGTHTDKSLQIPETVAETLGARDFDGDHVIIVEPEMRAQKLLKAYTDSIYRAHNIQEDMLNWIKVNKIPYKDTLYKEFVFLTVGRNQDILDLCIKANDLLAQGEVVPEELTKQFEATVAPLLQKYNASAKKQITIDDVKKELWVTKFNTEFYEDKPKDLYYINNPAVTTSKSFKATYSAKTKRYIDALAAQRLDTYRVIDSSTGEEGKKVFYTYSPEDIDSVYEQMLISNIYGAKLIKEYMSNIDPKDAASFVKTLTASTENAGFSKAFLTNEMDASLRILRSDLQDALSKGETNKAFVVYDTYLRLLEDNMRRYNKNTIKKVFKSDELQNLFKEQADILEQKEKGVALVNELRSKANIYPIIGDVNNAEKVNYVLQDALDNLYSTSKTLYVDDFKDMETANIFVVSSGFPISRDGIIYNRKASKPMYAYRHAVVSYLPGDKIADGVTKGAFLSKGTAIVTHRKEDKIKLSEDATIASIDRMHNKIYLESIHSPDGDIKVITNEGNKGPIHQDYSSSEDVDFIVNMDTMSPSKLYTSSNTPIDPADRKTINIKGPGGKIYTVEGYVIKSAVPTIAEDDSFYKNKSKVVDIIGNTDGYSIDLLHYTSDSQTVPGTALTGGWFLTLDKKGTLKWDPSRAQHLGLDLIHPERSIKSHNYVDAIQYCRMAYLINLLTEEEIAKEFPNGGTKIDIIMNKLSDVRVGSETYNAEINYLKDKYGNRINKKDPFLNRLFSNKLTEYMTGTISDKVSKVNPDNIKSKSKYEKQATYNKGKSTELYRSGNIISEESRDKENKYYKSYNDFYLTPLTALNYLFQDSGYVYSNAKLLDLTRRHLAPYSRSYRQAETSNNFKDTDTQYVTEKAPYDQIPLAHNPVKDGVKSSFVESPYQYNPTGNPKAHIGLTPPGFLIHHSGNAKDPKLLDLIISNRNTGYDNTMLIADIIYNLAGLDSSMSKEEKLDKFTKNNNIFTISQRLPIFKPNEDGDMELTMTKANFITDTASKLQSRIRKTVKDYNYMDKVVKKANALNMDEVLDNLDRTKLSKRQEEYQRYTKEADEAIDTVYKSLVDHNTGEIDDNSTIGDFHKDTHESLIQPPDVSSDGKSTLIFDTDPLLMSASGLKETSPEAIGVGRSVKRAYSQSVFVSQEPLAELNALQKAISNSSMSMNEFNEFTKYASLLKIRDIDDKSYKAHLEYFNLTDEEVLKYAPKIKETLTKNSAVGLAYTKYIASAMNLAKSVKAETGEAVDCLVTIMSPYKPKDKTMAANQAVATIHNVLNITKYDPTTNAESSMSIDFFNSSKAIIQELSKMHGVAEIKRELKRQELVSNDKLINKVNAMLDEAVLENSAELTGYKKVKPEVLEKQNQILQVIEDYTKVNTRSIKGSTVVEKYCNTYKYLDNELEILKTKFAEEFEGHYIDSYSEAQEMIDISDSFEMRKAAEVIQNYYWAKMICGTGIIESSPGFAKGLSDFINSISGEGKSLVNAYGQKYERGSFLHPLGSNASTANFKDNLSIAYNSNNPEIWNQFILEKIIYGDIYVLDNKVADYLNDNVYTTKMGNNVTKQLKSISKWSSALQMALPSKILSRLYSFTGFDYAMSILYNPRSIGKMGKARRDLLAAYQSKGKDMDPVLRKYMELEGQPIGLTGKDPVTFSEDISGPDKVMRVLDTLTDPLEFQNHLGRYALYLTALESFDNNDGWYGPVLYKKKAIDSLPSNEDKAMYVMDYMLGSPGGFPALSKKTSGYMLYATFPMTFTRTLGAWAMSLSKIAADGFLENNGKDWMRTAVVPSMGILGITGMGALITALICDLFGIEEEEKEKLINKKVSIDPIGTVLGGTPTATSSAINPLVNFEDMFITPFKDETYQHGKDYDKEPSIWKKLFGFSNANILSHLNPAIKTPIEIATGYDLYSSAPIDTKYYYTGMENAVRKLAGFFVGSGVANAIVDQNKMDAYSNDANFLDTLIQGTRRGIAYSIGNQKTYKKDTTNYYNNIYKINNYKAVTYPNRDADTEDLLNANYLDTSRNYNEKYGSYDYDDYKRISNIIKKMIHDKAEPAEVYSVIVSEYNKGVSESTLKVVLNNNSLIRRLNQIDTQAYLKTLSSKERESLVKAIEYEERMYPLLDEFFPNKPYTRKPYNKKYASYYKGGNGYIKPNYYPTYRPNKKPYYVYPTSVNSYRKYNNYVPKYYLEKQNVKVHPEMGIWSRDFNEIEDLDKRDFYLDNQLYNGLSSWEKKNKGSDK